MTSAGTIERVIDVSDTRPDRRPHAPASVGNSAHLSAEAYQPRLFEPDLTAKEADRRIAALKAEIELANSFRSIASGDIGAQSIALAPPPGSSLSRIGVGLMERILNLTLMKSVASGRRGS